MIPAINKEANLIGYKINLIGYKRQIFMITKNKNLRKVRRVKKSFLPLSGIYDSVFVEAFPKSLQATKEALHLKPMQIATQSIT